MDETAERPLGREAVDALVENHRAFLAFLQNRVGRREVAEDILQEAFARGLDVHEHTRAQQSLLVLLSLLFL